MELNKKMIVNPTPAKTWYWLKMNERHLAIDPNVSVYAPAITANGVKEDNNIDILSSQEGSAGTDAISLIRASVTSAPVYTADENSRVKAVFSLPENQTSASRIGLIVPEEKEMLCIMDYASAEGAEGAALIETLFTIGKNAHLTLVQIHRAGDDFTIINDIGGTVSENGRIDLINVVISGKENDLGCRFNLEGKRAHAEIHTGYSVTKNHLIDFNYYIPHFGKLTTCNIEANGVLRDEAKKVFRGTIDFRHGASGAVGAEKENVLLIDDTVSNQTLPVILCSEEDVEGTHGASIGKLDDSLLFYMQSRGLSTEQIYEMMAGARISAAISLIPDTETREELEAYLERKAQ